MLLCLSQYILRQSLPHIRYRILHTHMNTLDIISFSIYAFGLTMESAQPFNAHFSIVVLCVCVCVSMNEIPMWVSVYALRRYTIK